MITQEIKNDTLIISFDGQYNSKISKEDIELIGRIFHTDSNKFIINLNKISKFDLSFLIFLSSHLDYLKHTHKSYEIIAENKQILELLDNTNISKQSQAKIKKPNILWSFLAHIGRLVWEGINTGLDFINFIGKLIYHLISLLFNPRSIRYNAISYHIYHGVITAMPIIFIVSFIVGGVIAYQGGVTLHRMGVPGAMVEMTAKLTLREIGPFIVALIVAGRSASSYTAQIGVMKMTEELDAMKTMNFNLFNFIILPRFIALVISFPLMVFLSDLVSIFGCMVFLKIGFGISFVDYISQLKDFVDIRSFWVGIIKAPFYAATIAVVGCFVGFRVENNTQSVGEKTTKSVVYALFGVILVNALFSLIFTELRF